MLCGSESIRGFFPYPHSPFPDESNTPSEWHTRLLRGVFMSDCKKIYLTGWIGLDSGVKWREVDRVMELI